jgi:lipopolysaccharide biosynthesis regulator YciM
MENRRAPKAYFRGLNFLLNEQQDQAIDAFIEAVQNDPDTSELHFALGNLFRRRGEYERAVRVHQHLLSRGDLSTADRHRAQHALALDYLRAGLLDRAEEALLKLEGTPFESEARLALLANYERSRDWGHAAEVAQRLEHADQGSFAGRLAHYLCEQAAAQATPDATPLVAVSLAETALACKQAAAALALLRTSYEQVPALDTMEAIVRLEAASSGDGREGYIRHLEHEPSLIAAARWIAGEKLEHDQFHPLVQRALDHAVKPLSRYRCAACGFEAKDHFWQCPGCQAWDSYPPRRVEEL